MIRPLDDSDPEMRTLVQQFMATIPCGEPHGVCEAAIQILEGGGDRAAGYLISQYEAGLAEGHLNRGSYLRFLGYTRSDAAFDFLSGLVTERAAALEDGTLENEMDLIFAIEGLGRTQDARVSEQAASLYARFDDLEIRHRALNAIRRSQARHPVSSEIIVQLQATRAARLSRRSERSREVRPISTSEQRLRAKFDEMLLRASVE